MAKTFGTCCNDLRDAMHGVPQSFLREEDNGVLFLTVGYVPTENGPGFFDQAVMFCPFCGLALQTRDEVAKAAQD